MVHFIQQNGGNSGTQVHSIQQNAGKSGTWFHFILGKVGLRSNTGNVELRSILMLVKYGLSSSGTQVHFIQQNAGKSGTQVHFIQQITGKSGTQVHFILGMWNSGPAKCWEKWDLVPKMLGKVEPRPSLSSKMLDSWSILSSKMVGIVEPRSILSRKVLHFIQQKFWE